MSRATLIKLRPKGLARVKWWLKTDDTFYISTSTLHFPGTLVGCPTFDTGHLGVSVSRRFGAEIGGCGSDRSGTVSQSICALVELIVKRRLSFFDCTTVPYGGTR